MKEDLIEELAGYRIGMDAALEFAKNNLPDSLGTNKLMEARSSLGRACFYLGSKNPYPNSAQTNHLIEDGSDRAEIINGAEPGYILSVKSMISACEKYLGSITHIRMTPIPRVNITYTFLLNKALDRCIDRLEDAMGWYHRDLRDWKEKNETEYREVLKSEERSSEYTVPEDAVRTDEMMKQRKDAQNQ